MVWEIPVTGDWGYKTKFLKQDAWFKSKGNKTLDFVKDLCSITWRDQITGS